MFAVRCFEQHDVPLLRRAEARFERLKKPHAQLAEFNLFDEHSMLRRQTNTRSILRRAGIPQRSSHPESSFETALELAAGCLEQISSFASSGPVYRLESKRGEYRRQRGAAAGQSTIPRPGGHFPGPAAKRTL